MSGQLLNCAVVGLGVGEQHAAALLQEPKAALKAVVEHDDSKVVMFRHKYQVNMPHRSFEDCVADHNVDLLSLASFDDDHFLQVMASLKNGKHVFVEKPLCQTSDQLRQIHKLWKRQKLGLSSNLVLREAPLYKWLKGVIESGQMGQIYAFDGDYLYGRIHKITEGWRSQTENYSVMEGGGIHIIDLMLWLTGEKPTHVYSVANKIATRGTPFKYPDFQTSTFSFKSG